jgi:hypothetical protein
VCKEWPKERPGNEERRTIELLGPAQCVNKPEIGIRCTLSDTPGLSSAGTAVVDSASLGFFDGKKLR